jgi:hypothetical protein
VRETKKFVAVIAEQTSHAPRTAAPWVPVKNLEKVVMVNQRDDRQRSPANAAPPFLTSCHARNDVRRETVTPIALSEVSE